MAASGRLLVAWGCCLLGLVVSLAAASAVSEAPLSPRSWGHADFNEWLRTWGAPPAGQAKPTCVKPICHWSCHDPECERECRPVCYRPKCHMACTETCAACTVQCPPPSCSVRCPVGSCTPDGCPACEAVCDPSAAARCTVSCAAAQPACVPACEKPQCFQKCRLTRCKGTLGLPRPRCKLVCRRPTDWCRGSAAAVVDDAAAAGQLPFPAGQVAPGAQCALPPHFPCQLARAHHAPTSSINANGPQPLDPRRTQIAAASNAVAANASACCPCSQMAHAAEAMRFADAVCDDEACRSAPKPSLLEVIADAAADAHQCCPCAAAAEADILTDRERELRALAALGAEALQQRQLSEQRALEQTPLFSSYSDLVGAQTRRDAQARGLSDLPQPPYPGYPSPLGRSERADAAAAATPLLETHATVKRGGE